MARKEFRPVYGFHLRGDTLPVLVAFPPVGGQVPDITGHIIFCTMKQSLEQADESALFSVAHTVPASSEAAQGRAAFDVPCTAMDVPPGLYWLDIQHVIPGSPPKVQTLHMEQLEIRGDATRRVSAP